MTSPYPAPNVDYIVVLKPVLIYKNKVFFDEHMLFFVDSRAEVMVSKLHDGEPPSPMTVSIMDQINGEKALALARSHDEIYLRIEVPIDLYFASIRRTAEKGGVIARIRNGRVDVLYEPVPEMDRDGLYILMYTTEHAFISLTAREKPVLDVRDIYMIVFDVIRGEIKRISLNIGLTADITAMFSDSSAIVSVHTDNLSDELIYGNIIVDTAEHFLDEVSSVMNEHVELVPLGVMVVPARRIKQILAMKSKLFEEFRREYELRNKINEIVSSKPSYQM